MGPGSAQLSEWVPLLQDPGSTVKAAVDAAKSGNIQMTQLTRTGASRHSGSSTAESPTPRPRETAESASAGSLPNGKPQAEGVRQRVGRTTTFADQQPHAGPG